LKRAASSQIGGLIRMPNLPRFRPSLPSFRDAPLGAGPESITTDREYGFRARAPRAPE
jgi:hypothetical protein